MTNARAAVRETVEKWLWSCMVVGDRLFPALQGKKIAGKVHASGVVVLVVSLSLPVFLAARMIHRIANITRRQDPSVQRVMEQNRAIMEKSVVDARHRRENTKQQPKPQEGTIPEANR